MEIAVFLMVYFFGFFSALTGLLVLIYLPEIRTWIRIFFENVVDQIQLMRYK
jgi:hypothetical protein